MRLQTPDSKSTSQIVIDNVNGTLSALGLAINSPSISYSLIGTTVDASQSASRLALDAIVGAVGSLTSSRGRLGGAESRLRTAIQNLEVSRGSFAAAESQIRDTDVAEDAAELTRLGILQQAGAAVLSQANQLPSLALQLIGG